MASCSARDASHRLEKQHSLSIRQSRNSDHEKFDDAVEGYGRSDRVDVRFFSWVPSLLRRAAGECGGEAER